MASSVHHSFLYSRKMPSYFDRQLNLQQSATIVRQMSSSKTLFSVLIRQAFQADGILLRLAGSQLQCCLLRRHAVN